MIEKGSRVMINETCKLYNQCKGQVFTVCCEPFESFGIKCVKLDGLRGNYAISCLTEYSKAQDRMEFDENNIVVLVYNENETRQLILNEDALKLVAHSLKIISQVSGIKASPYNLGKIEFLNKEEVKNERR